MAVSSMQGLENCWTMRTRLAHLLDATAIDDLAIMTEPASPCRNVCRLSPQTGLCEGCLRSREEIAGWKRFSPPEKWSIVDRIAGRQRSVGLMIAHSMDEKADDL